MQAILSAAFLRQSGKLAIVALVAACSSSTPEPQKPMLTTFEPVQSRSLSAGKASFLRVKARILPVGRRACTEARAKNPATNCQFRVSLEPNRVSLPDARYKFDKQNRPTIVFNHAMLTQTRNDDELAMVLSHEMGHQIARHIERIKADVRNGAISGATTAKRKGTDQKKGAKLGAAVAFIAFSRAYELEADRISAQIMLRAGYAPTHGLPFFDRLPESASLLSRHPKHPARIQTYQSWTDRYLWAEANGKRLPLRW